MIKKYNVGGPWDDMFDDEYDNSSKYIRLSDPNAKLSKASGIKLNNLWNNFNIKLKDSNGGMSGFIDKHPYLSDTVSGAVSGATMLLNSQSQRQAKKAQRDYVNDPFNLYATSSMRKTGSMPYLMDAGQYTDMVNQKTPVFEPGYQNSAYLNPMATAKKGGQLYMAFQGGGATNQMGSGSSLPKYEMGAGSPVQQALLRDSQHYGLPMAKQGGFFTPEKLTASTENEELYNKPNNFLNYLRDMSANTIMQNALGRKRKGQLTEQEEMGMAQMGMQAPQQAAPQQGGQQEQLMQMVAQALQQGASPEEVMQKLVEMGIPEEQAMQVVQMVAEQMQGGEEQMPEEMPQEMAQPQMQQQMPMAQLGMGGGGGDFEEFGFDNQNPLNPYYQNLYDPSEAKQVNASLMQGLYNAGQDLFSQPIAGAKRRQAEAQAKLDQLQNFIAPKARYGGSYQQQGAVQQPSFYDEAMEQYKWFTENPDSWAGDPDMTNEDGSLNLCIDCLNVDWNNPDHIQGITRLMEEGLSKGPHMEQNHNMYLTKLKEFGLPEPKLPQKKTMKRGGITRFQTKGNITKPTATDAAGFEKWYNETMGKLLSDPTHTEADIKSFMDMAGNWASDIKVDRNQLQDQANNPNRYRTPGLGGIEKNTARMTRGDKQDEYEKEYLDILKKFDSDYDVAVSKNQIASKRNDYKADSKYLTDLETARDNAIQALESKYVAKPSSDAPDYFYNKPGAAATTTTTTPGTTTTTGPGGYQFNPAMQQLLGAMAAGYSKAPLFGFRTNRNINALFNQTMADMMLRGQGQGQGTASATGASMPGVPATGPNGAANTWFKDNNINRYDIKQGPNRFKMKIRANQDGRDIVQYDQNGKLITTPNGGPGGSNGPGNPGFFRNLFGNKYNQSKFNVNQTDPNTKVDYTRLQSTINPEDYAQSEALLNPNRANRITNKMQRIGDKVDRMYQYHNMLNDIDNKYDKPPVEYTFTNREQNRINRLTDRYNDLAGEHGREEYTKPIMPTKAYGGSYAYGGAYATGGQYKEGGTYYLSDEEIQALMDAGYELE